MGIKGKKNFGNEMGKRMEGVIDEPSSLKIVTGFCQSTMMTLSAQKKAHTRKTVGTDGRVGGTMRRKGRERIGVKSGD